MIIITDNKNISVLQQHEGYKYDLGKGEKQKRCERIDTYSVCVLQRLDRGKTMHRMRVASIW